MNRKAIAAYLIVRNEETLLPRALESVRGCDEIVILDTGSQDNTWDVARDWLAAWQTDAKSSPGTRRLSTLSHFPWQDDFAAARNAALDLCAGDWCLVIDADEYLAPGALDALRAKLATYEGTTLRFVARCESNPAQWHHMVRAHRRAPEIRWRHRIHECLTHDDRHLAEGCEIIYGHSPAHALDPDRSIRILRAVLADDPQNARGLYYLGRDLGYRREFAEAIGLLQRRVALTPDPNPGETTDAWLLLARALWHSQRGPEAREACGVAIARNSHFREALFALAGMCYEPHRSRWMEMAKTADNSGVHFVRF